MPPAIILSPYSGRAVKIREQDLGRALRDEEGRVFYVVEDPEHGRYAARTRKGSPKDLERYRKIEADAAQLDDATQPARQNLAQAHDAAGNKRRNPLGLLVIVLLLAASAALGYVYLNHPDWLGLGTDEPESQNDADATAPAEPTSQATPAHQAAEPVAIKAASDPKPQPDRIDRPGLAAAPLPNRQPDPARQPIVLSATMPDGMDPGPEPVYVSAVPRTKQASEPKVVPITLATRQPRQTRYEDFRHTASGLRFKITHLTDGTSARAGNYVTIRYTAETLEGLPLIDDASQSFILASGQAIRAFDEGLAGIREGEQLRLLVPKGHSENGTLPGIKRVPDQPFLLDIQLVSVRPGVTYIIEEPGDLDRRPAMPGDRVALHYIAKVEGRDEIIDATVHRGEPMRITLGNNEVIEGLELGITGMRPGESRQLTVPPYLAYGKYSVAGGLIPENAVLSFRLSLVEIIKDDQ